jgi:NAD(P)-dependent dehydrogenase (short-subunit alcohol dehydrogenase family)
MVRVLITGSTAGLGRAAARHLLHGGHEVVLHARNSARAGSVDDLTAFTLAVARRWPDLRAHAVDPGWVPTRMGGPGAPDDLELGSLTQTWLAGSDHPEATGSGGYWFHQRRRSPAPAALDESFQNALLDELIQLTDVRLP